MRYTLEALVLLEHELFIIIITSFRVAGALSAFVLDLTLQTRACAQG